MVHLKDTLINNKGGITLENLEIIISDLLKNELNDFIKHEINKNPVHFKSSHFYNSEENRDLTFHEVMDFERILSPKGTGNIVLNSFDMDGISIVDVVFVFSFDKEVGDIVINFPLNKNNIVNDKDKIIKIVNHLLKLKLKYSIKEILFGYETDEENMIRISNKEEEIHLEEQLRKLELIDISQG